MTPGQDTLGISKGQQMEAGLTPLNPSQIQAHCDRKKAYYNSLYTGIKTKFPY